MVTVCGHRGPAWASIWFAERNSEAQARSNPDRLVIKSEPAAGGRQGQQPVSGMWG